MELDSIEQEQETNSQEYANGLWWVRFDATADQLTRFPEFYNDVLINLLGGNEVDENELVESVRRFLIANGAKSDAYKWIEVNLLNGDCGDEHYQSIESKDVNDFITGAWAGFLNLSSALHKVAKRNRQPA